jgi:hypothetical protein
MVRLREPRAALRLGLKQEYFQVSPLTVHEMIKTRDRNGLIERTAGEDRSIRPLVALEHLPALE